LQPLATATATATGSRLRRGVARHLRQQEVGGAACGCWRPPRKPWQRVAACSNALRLRPATDPPQ
jgi:hypothetical protein